MKNYVLMAESGADIPESFVKKYGIEIVPMHLGLGDKLYDDGQLSVKEVFSYYDKTGKLPTTSGANPQDFEKAFDRIHQQFPDKHIIHLAYSAVTTVSFQSAKIASADRDYITSIDTKMVSAGQAIIVIRAAEFLEAHPDASLEEVKTKVNQLIKSARMCFMPETLLYLKAGGRVSNSAYLGARLMNIKPLIELKNGELISTKKYRGSMTIAMRKLMNQYIDEQQLTGDELTLVYSEGLADKVRHKAEEIAKEKGFHRVLWIPTGCVVSIHGGPEAFGIVGFSGDN